MPLPPSPPQDTQAAVAVLVTIVAACSVTYWRTALTAILIAVLILVAYPCCVGGGAVGCRVVV